jgi:nucleotide-binding universal stress UspA family protein
MDIKSILLPVDFSPASGEAFRIATALARQFRATLHVIHVLDVTDLKRAMKCARYLSDAVWDEERRDIRDRLEEMRALFPDVQIVTETVTGQADEEIVNYAKQHCVSLIVVGSHGRSGVQRAIMGSVAELLMRSAPCPILVVKAKSVDYRRTKV